MSCIRPSPCGPPLLSGKHSTYVAVIWLVDLKVLGKADIDAPTLDLMPPWSRQRHVPFHLTYPYPKVGPPTLIGRHSLSCLGCGGITGQPVRYSWPVHRVSAIVRPALGGSWGRMGCRAVASQGQTGTCKPACTERKRRWDGWTACSRGPAPGGRIQRSQVCAPTRKRHSRGWLRYATGPMYAVCVQLTKPDGIVPHATRPLIGCAGEPPGWRFAACHSCQTPKSVRVCLATGMDATWHAQHTKHRDREPRQ